MRQHSRLVYYGGASPVKILSLEVISDQVLGQLRRDARRERKKASARALDLTGRDLIGLLLADCSEFDRRFAQGHTRHESKSVLAGLPTDHGKYEDEEGVKLLQFARRVGAPVLAKLDCEPSKRFEESLRHSAKIRGCRLHFFRLIDAYVALRVTTPSESDASFLERLDTPWREI
jgi:hypothetical protein